MDSLLVSHERQSVGASWENHSLTATQKYVKELLDCTKSVEENLQILPFTNCSNACSFETFITYHTI